MRLFFESGAIFQFQDPVKNLECQKSRTKRFSNQKISGFENFKAKKIRSRKILINKIHRHNSSVPIFPVEPVPVQGYKAFLPGSTTPQQVTFPLIRLPRRPVVHHIPVRRQLVSIED